MINPKSIGDELRSINKVSVSKARVYKKNYESVVNSLKESVESANDNIATLKELAAKENKSHMESWDKVTSPRMAQIQLTAMRKQSTQ